jgi:L-ribulose-5-phosphate 3-epimerase
MSQSPIACRTASYGPYEQLAYEHLASLGIRHVEIPVPSADQLDATCAELARFGLTATSLHGNCDVSRPDVTEQVAAQMPALAALGAPLMFVSVKAGQTPVDVVYTRLHQAGEAAAAHGVTIVLETHPDLVSNAAIAQQTMQAVDHPRLRINFDTANVYFYNRGVDAVAELRQIMPYVASLHLKDTDGGFGSWHFPALGRGVVRFRDVFAILDDAGFSGPCTLEIEGIEDEVKTERLICDRIAESVGFLRGLGRM